MYVKDAYEPDGTPATAKVLPEMSWHTLANGGTSVADLDWSKITVTATGTPLLVDVSQRSKGLVPAPVFYAADAGQPDGVRAVQAIPSLPWGGDGAVTTFLYHAPKPGDYFVKMRSANGDVGSYTLVEQQGAAAQRIAGYDRFSTAAAVSRQMWPKPNGGMPFYFLSGDGAAPAAEASESPAGCIVTTGRDFADALAASAWINFPGEAQRRLPILLTDTQYPPGETYMEIMRLGSLRQTSNLPFTVYILGSKTAVSSELETMLSYMKDDMGSGASLVTDVVRLAGPSRFDTAARIAQEEASSAVGIGDTVFIVNGFSFPDALCAGPVAGASRSPVLMVKTNAIPESTKAFIASHPSIRKAVVVGGPSVVGTSVVAALESAPLSLATTRVAGKNRYETSRAVAEYGAQHGLVPHSVTLVTGADFPDGLSAAGLSAFQRSPILLTPGEALSSAVPAFLANHAIDAPSFIVGGPPAVSGCVEDRFNAVLCGW